MGIFTCFSVSCFILLLVSEKCCFHLVLYVRLFGDYMYTYQFKCQYFIKGHFKEKSVSNKTKLMVSITPITLRYFAVNMKEKQCCQIPQNNSKPVAEKKYWQENVGTKAAENR
jgi:hypothetical protein